MQLLTLWNCLFLLGSLILRIKVTEIINLGVFYPGILSFFCSQNVVELIPTNTVQCKLTIYLSLNAYM